LNREHIADVALVAVAPQIGHVASVDELRGDAHPLPGAAHAAFE
jgi:hypothetical protein